MTGRIWRLAEAGSSERALFEEQVDAIVDNEPGKDILREGVATADDGNGSPFAFPRVLEDWQPMHMLRMRAIVTGAIHCVDLETLDATMRGFRLSPHVPSSTEAALLARARVERGVSPEERANVLYNDALTYLVMSLHMAPCEGATAIQRVLLGLCQERGTLARDMAAEIPSVVTPDGVAGTVVHLAVGNGHTAFLRRVLDEFGVDPARLPPFLGAHTPLCWAAMTNQRGTMRVVMEHYKRRGMLVEALTAPCHHTLTPAQAAERRGDPLPVRPPYLLVFHAIEHRALCTFQELIEDPYVAHYEAYMRHEYKGRVLGVQDLCALHAWRAGLELMVGQAGDESTWRNVTERQRNVMLNHVVDGTGETMLHLAVQAERSEGEILATVELLLDRGSHPGAEDSNGRLPGDISQERGHLRVAAAITVKRYKLQEDERKGKKGFRPQLYRAASPEELLAMQAAAAKASVTAGSTPRQSNPESNPSPAAAAATATTSRPPMPPSAVPAPAAAPAAAMRGPKRTGLTPPPGLASDVEKAAKSGDLQRLEECTRKWDAAHPQAPACFGTDVWVPALWLAAHEASMAGRVRVLKWLVEEKGVRVHRLLPEEEALILASRHSAAPFQTPLASAIWGDQEVAALYLLRAGAARGDIDVGRECGEGYSTLLFLAVARRNVGVRLLTALMEEGGFDPGVKNALSVTPLGLAAGQGRIELADAMVAYAGKHGRLKSAFTCCMAPDGNAPGLFTMVLGGRQLEMAKHLLATVRQAEVSGFDLFHSAVLEACKGHYAPSIRFLLTPGRAAGYGARPVDVNARIPGYPGDGYTLLHVVLAPPPTVLEARRPGEVLGAVKALLEVGADPTIRDEHGKTPIQLARETGLGDAAELMEGVASKGQREEAARAAEAELLGLLEQEEAKASKKQQKKGKKKGKGKSGGTAAAAAGGGGGADGAEAGLAAVTLADSDAEEEKAAAAAGEQQPEQELQGEARPPPLSEEEAFILARAEAEAPDFVCPLTERIMRDAALASDGFSYERAAIEAHIRRCQAAGRTPDSPKTGETIDPMLLPNRGLMSLIDMWLREQRQAFLVRSEKS